MLWHKIKKLLKKNFLLKLIVSLFITFTLSFYCLASDGAHEFIYLKSKEVNLRSGPGKEYPIEWVIESKGEPVILLQKFDQWFKVQDFEGASGWAHVAMVSKTNKYAIVRALKGSKHVLMYARDDSSSRMLCKLEGGVRLKVRKCKEAWCKVEVQDFKGWIESKYLWGV